MDQIMIERYAETLLACSTMSDVQHAFGIAIANDGFFTSAARAFTPRSKHQVETFFLNWPEEWKKLSIERQFVKKSPVVSEARRRHAPFTWEQLKGERLFSAEENEVWALVVEWGWTDGFVVPIHGPCGYAATIAMASKEKQLKLPPATRMRLYMLAILTHERCRSLSKFLSASPLDEALTARELECLKWVADGQTDERIGVILGISSETVRFHVDNVRGKLGVRNRAQAVAQLYLSGLL
ncbi:LuxR family transcriptional regulator [Bosea caraganae]|uniref:LuxR family transcriptional regulator n=1 Tax=Bosea caraganae TaxID=2763117 RepID=A0A370L2H7_9HYPH|nr:LuxR family transcriptional regulator [Bosea caraganae]RDJ22399.1 LuxR family transcriptional regulator [Bosea caraganae]RDJ30358.1 LuxR family transcriptional regulator [Bosea caraganae]